MNKMLTVWTLAWLLVAGGCTPNPTKQPEPLVLPYTLYEQNYRGNLVTVTLQNAPDDPDHYAFDIVAHTAEGQTKFGVYVITAVLTEGYPPDTPVNWTERIGDQTGSGGVWEGEILGAQALTSSVGYGLGDSADHPAAIFVRLVAADTAEPGLTHGETYGPVAVLQILPDGQGVIRLDTEP